MEKIFKKPTVVGEAANSQKGYHIVVEILFFLLVFFVSVLAQEVIYVPVTMISLFQNQEFFEAIATMDMEKVTEITNQFANSPLSEAGLLFSNIGLIVISIVFCKLLQKRKIRTLGFFKKNILKEYAMGMGLGFGMFTVAMLICMVTGTVKIDLASGNFSMGWLLVFLVGYLIQGMAEEVLLRGVVLVSIARKHSLITAILVNSIAFSVLHMANPGIGVLPIINLTLFGIFASVYFIKRGSIWGIGAMHSIWNFAQGKIYGIRVSGISVNYSIFGATTSESGALWNGGEFGLEGGLAVTIVILIGIVLVTLRMPQREIYEENVVNIESSSMGIEQSM